MKLHKSIKPELVASKDKTRQTMTQVYLRNGNLLATNGKALVSIPVETNDHDMEGFISPSVLKLARKQANRAGMAELTVNGVAQVGDIQLPRSAVDKGEQFPRFDAVIPSHKDREDIDDMPEGKVFRIGLNAKLLADLAESMGTEGVVLEITGNGRGFVVRPTHTGMGDNPPVPEAFGVLMPLRFK